MGHQKQQQCHLVPQPPQCGTPHSRGSKIRAFVFGCSAKDWLFVFLDYPCVGDILAVLCVPCVGYVCELWLQLEQPILSSGMSSNPYHCQENSLLDDLQSADVRVLSYELTTWTVNSWVSANVAVAPQKLFFRIFLSASVVVEEIPRDPFRPQLGPRRTWIFSITYLLMSFRRHWLRLRLK